MTQKTTLFIWLVLFLSSFALAVVGVSTSIGYDILPNSMSHLVDRSPTTLAIMAVFSLGVFANGINTRFVLRQLSFASNGVKKIRSGSTQQVAANGLLGLHIERLYDTFGEQSTDSVDQSTSLNAIRNQLIRREWIVRTASSLLLTLGLIGTVLGLTKSLGGLSTTVNAVAQESIKSNEPEPPTTDQAPSDTLKSDSDDVSIGLNEALGGMASAFLTTLFGAVFGGVCLKMLCGCTECFTEELVDRIELVTEASVLPNLRASPAALIQRREREFRGWVEHMETLAINEFERFGELSARIDQITANFERMADSMKQAEKHLIGSRTQVANLVEMNELVEKWNRFTSSRIAKMGIALCCVIAVIGIARFCVDLVS